MTYGDDPDRAVAALEEASARRRAADLPSPLAYAQLGLGVVLPPEESGRAFAALDEAVALMTELDDQRGIANALGIKGGRAGLAGDWSAMVHASADAIEQHRRLGGTEAGRVAAFMGATVALGNLSQFETSALMLGYVMKATAEFGTEQFIEMIETNKERLREALGETRFAELNAEGAALGIAQALARLRSAEHELDE